MLDQKEMIVRSMMIFEFGWWVSCMFSHFSHVQLFVTPQPPRPFCPWEFPSKNAGVGSYFLLQGLFLTQRLNPCLLHCRWILYHEPWGKPRWVWPYSKCITRTSPLVQWLRIHLAGNMSLIPGLGRFLLPLGNDALVPQLLSLCA